MKKMKMKNQLDERQELKLLRIESRACWIGFFGIALSIFVQNFSGASDWRTLAGELCVLTLMALYLLAACIRQGIWDRHLKANGRTNAAVSVLSALCIGLYHFFRSYVRWHALAGALAVGAFMAFFSGLSIFLALTAASWFYRRRVRQEEEQEEEI